MHIASNTAYYLLLQCHYFYLGLLFVGRSFLSGWPFRVPNFLMIRVWYRRACSNVC